MSLRLSIIVPAYKVEDYIEKCIRSLEDQDIPKTDYEIIVTNDGSPDRCKEIVESLQQEFSNIVLVDQENQGVSMARNNAIAIAKGRYVMPIDPDDYVVPQLLKSILDRTESDHLDVLVLGFEIFDPRGTSIWKTDYRQQESQVYSGVEGYFASRGYEIRDPDRSWAILYRNEMLQQHQLQYPKDVPFLEDGCFLLKVFAVANQVGFSNINFYQRTTSEGSATVSGVFYSDKAIDGFLKAAANLKIFAHSCELTFIQQGLLNHGIVKYIVLSISQDVSIRSFGRFIATLDKLKAKGFSKLSTSGVRGSYKTYARWYNISPYFFFVQYAKEIALKRIRLGMS
jgi:glycosyltransferase involved in cell wall biosynthesis